MDSHQFTVTNTLVCLIQGIQGKSVKIDLRNDGVVVGLLDSVDSGMNCYLKNGYVIQNGRGRTNFEDFYLQGKHIRYVHIPEHVNIYGAMNKALVQHERLYKPNIKKKGKNSDRKNLLKEPLETIFGGDLDII